MKKCCVCNLFKDLQNFHKDSKSPDKHRYICKLCSKEYDKKRNKDPNRASSLRKEYFEQYRETNREVIREKSKQPEIKLLRRKKSKEKYNKDIRIKLRQCFVTYLRRSLNGKKNKSFNKLVPYTIDQLKLHLESLFQPGMSWSNYGLHGWHIDHKTPLSWFEFDSYEHPEFKKAWSLNNLQPKWAVENWSKGNKYTE